MVLFDEIEKAHPDIFNSLLQILEEGRLTDGQGRVVDFKNTVIIMTTNLGTKDITGGPVGFTLEGNVDDVVPPMRGKVVEELKKHFKPEFLNRVDETIVFPQLNKEELLQIVGLFIKRLAERLLDRDMTIELSDAAKERLIELGWDPTLGARPLRRAVQHEIEDRLSEKILHGELERGRPREGRLRREPAGGRAVHLHDRPPEGPRGDRPRSPRRRRPRPSAPVESSAAEAAAYRRPRPSIGWAGD